MGKRQRRREREKLAEQREQRLEAEIETVLKPERQDVTVIPETAAAAGGSGPEEDKD